MEVPAEIKQISITGGAAEAFQGGTRRKRSRRSRKNLTSEETYLPIKGLPKILLHGGIVRNNRPPEPPVALPQGPVALPQGPVVPVVQQGPVVPLPQPQQVAIQPQQGGKASESTKLVLMPPKRKETRLLMKAPKGQKPKEQAQTRKNVRKITLGLRGLTIKIERATKLHKKVKDMKVEDVKKLLVEKGILKEGKKNLPEALIRQMYSDYLILTSKGL